MTVLGILLIAIIITSAVAAFGARGSPGVAYNGTWVILTFILAVLAALGYFTKVF